MRRVIDDIPLGYDSAGTGAALVLLHGFPFDRTIWDAQFTILAQRCRVIRVDLRGAGESGAAQGPALMETLAGDVFGLLDALGIERAIVAGHSLGGYVALAYFRMYAERVAGLALIASDFDADSAERPSRHVVLEPAVRTRGIDALLEPQFLATLGVHQAESDAPLARHVRALIGRQSAAGVAAQIAGMHERLSSQDLIEDITVPVTLLAGDNDPYVCMTQLALAAAALPDCDFVTLSGVGHLPMLEAPQATTAALERLILRCASLRPGFGTNEPGVAQFDHTPADFLSRR